MNYKIANKIYNLKYLISVTKYQRAFCIFDKNLPWKLNVEYFSPHEENDYYPVYNGKSFTYVNFPKTVFSKNDTYRMTEKECDKHIKNVARMEPFLKGCLTKEELEYRKTFKK